ncbi:hypothetical protein [Falsihalocynthiibacter arcticus]|uniref:Uncharacterized protein n=1 Tax=Falsihalocynthiibacter arcticus TaxID=1579316 RepID=A0A126V375_9RHOB|nr:hypothetical protein [Falsihalocynthiibacter arcticus]AML52607.1 hypothetical protein RC74_16210 [Falsihalocynthiibacter arcticus]
MNFTAARTVDWSLKATVFGGCIAKMGVLPEKALSVSNGTFRIKLFDPETRLQLYLNEVSPFFAPIKTISKEGANMFRNTLIPIFVALMSTTVSAQISQETLDAISIPDKV